MLYGITERLSKLLLRTDGNNRMTGDLLMDSSKNDSISIGCVDFGTAEKSFGVYLGNVNNALVYNTLAESPPVTLYTSDGFLVRAQNRNIIKFRGNQIDLFKDINANGNYIYNLRAPLHNYDACTKGYVDTLAKKCYVGLIPVLSRNADKSGYTVTASSEHSSTFAGYKAFRFGNTEWATNGEISNFWIKIKCLEAVRVWKFVLTGKRNDSSEQIYNWRFEGSNDDSDWTTLYSETSHQIDSLTHQFNVENNTNSYQYYRIFVVEGLGPNPGLSHIQVFYSD